MLLFLYYLVSNYLTHKDATPPTDGQHLSAKIWQYWETPCRTLGLPFGRLFSH